MSPAFLSLFWFAGVIEVVGGVLVLLGLFTRPAAFISRARWRSPTAWRTRRRASSRW